MNIEALYRRSIEIIQQNQAPSGAYLACPNFGSYTYSWLRDGSFIAYAMDLAGEHASSRAFFCWVSRTLLRYRHKVEAIEASLAENRPLQDGDFLHTRYSTDGDEVYADKTWGNFQLDGYGTWLWALGEHLRLTGDSGLLDEVREGANLTVRYIRDVWKLPNFDCWEEHPEYLHPSTLGAAYAGLRAAGEIGLGDTTEEVQAIARYILAYGTDRGRLVKHIAPAKNGTGPHPVYDAGVDASLIGLCTPYRVMPAADPIFQATLAQIEADLHRPGGGVYRFRSDTYYGGGEWLLLAGWLGWHYAASGQAEKAQALLDWMASQAGEPGHLPEQVSGHVLAPQYLQPWQEKWGLVATPLVWSHAMFVILYQTLAERQSEAWTLTTARSN